MPLHHHHRPRNQTPSMRLRKSGPPPALLLLLIALTTAIVTIPFSRHSTPPPSLLTLPEEKLLRARTAHSACPSAPPLYVFLHLHKTAGNTLKAALFAFAKRNRLNLHHTCHAAVSDTPVLAWWFQRWKSASAMDCNLDTLASMSVAERGNVDLVMGHQYVGVHTLFPGRDVRYFTFVRHPVARKVSHFVHFEPDARKDPARLARYLVERNRNYMVKRLATDAQSGEIVADLRGRFVDVDNFAARAALRAAKRNLAARFFFVGLQERYAESVCVLARVLNVACGRDGHRLASGAPMRPWKMYRMRENERGRTRRIVAKMAEGLRKAVLRAEAADLELYRFAHRLFEQKLDMYPECRNATEHAAGVGESVE